MNPAMYQFPLAVSGSWRISTGNAPSTGIVCKRGWNFLQSPLNVAHSRQGRQNVQTIPHASSPHFTPQPITYFLLW